MQRVDVTPRGQKRDFVQRAIVGGVPVDAYDRKGLISRFLREVESKCAHPKLVFSMNGEGVHKYHTDSLFRECIDSADVVHADGMSVVKAGNKFTEAHFPERIATTDFFHDVAQACVSHSLTLYLLGANSDVLMLAVERVRSLYPGIQIVGYHHGYFQDGSQEESEVVDEINRLSPDVVFVGLGRPRQELWCLRMREKLHGVTWLKTCGGLFDFLSGNSSRAPQWMQDAGLEWMYRMLREPRRLFWRYLITNIYSLYCYRFKR